MTGDRFIIPRDRVILLPCHPVTDAAVIYMFVDYKNSNMGSVDGEKAR